MEKADAIEAQGIVQRTLMNLLGAINNATGQPAINAKMMIGWTIANSLQLLYYDQMGQPLNSCFDLTRQAGATLPKMEIVRILLDAETPQTLGATIVRDRSINFTLAQEGKIIGGMVFKSRQDVDDLIDAIQIPFNKAEEVAADTMDPMDYRGIIELRAAIINHLVTTARPLPSMVDYWFASPLPSLVISQRLYGDGSRYDEIRNENRVVHPAFCPMEGQALSA
jgi:prophage DNA circulation protein